MQHRHSDRWQYFCEQADTARRHYLDYLRPHTGLSAATRVLEIGCGEGGNLLPFAELGCAVTGIDQSRRRIAQARRFFAEAGRRGTFLCQDFLSAVPPRSEAGRYDVVLLHDVIEHIDPRRKRDFLCHVQPFLKRGGLLFVGFPAWQNPFGGHQQIAVGWASKLPFIHLLPGPLYRLLLRLSGTPGASVAELMSICRAGLSVERFSRLATAAGFSVRQRTLWLVNPHYQAKFHLRPRRLPALLAGLPWVRNFFTTAAFYLLAARGGEPLQQGGRAPDGATSQAEETAG